MEGFYINVGLMEGKSDRIYWCSKELDVPSPMTMKEFVNWAPWTMFQESSGG